MVQLQSGPLVCELEPRLGGCIAGLRFGGVRVLRPAPPGGLASAQQSSAYALVPCANQLPRAALQWQGTLYPLLRSEGLRPHAIHGLAWQRPWELLECDGAYALLSFEHAPDASWPHAFDSSQTVCVRDTALELTLSLTNQSSQPAPAGLGWCAGFVKRPAGRLSFVAESRWAQDDGRPPHRHASPGVDSAVATLQLDDCYDGWRSVAQLTDERLRVRLTSNLARLVVHADPTQEWLALEPVSPIRGAPYPAAGAPNADDLGLVILQPGESLTASMTIELEGLA